MRRGKPTFILSAFCCALAASFASSIAFAYDASLVEAARKEGQLNWYTVQIVDQFARPAAEAFQKRFGIKVNFVRGNVVDNELRIMKEVQSGHLVADVFDGSETVVALKRAHVTLQWSPEAAKRLPPNARDPEGYWTATDLYVLTPAYNTNLIPPGQQPKTLDDLLNPKWKGKMVWSSSPAPSAAPGFIGLALAKLGPDKGEAYLRDLSAQKITGVKASARQILDQTIAGEYSIALQTFNYHSPISAAQGAPVDWIPMSPAMAFFSAAAITKDAPHPNAAKLFVEFLVSEDGQNLFKQANYIPVDPDVPPQIPATRPDGSTFDAIYFTPEQIDADMPKWVALYNKYFR